MGKKFRFLLGSSDHVLFKTTGPQCTSDIHIEKLIKHALYCFYIVIKRFGGCIEKYNFTDKKKTHKFSLGASDRVLFKIIMQAMHCDLKDLDIAVKNTILQIKT